jgi:phospho-N-acetylmuramoyl-pentapeptide-transferase
MIVDSIIIDVVKIILPAAVTFIVGILITPYISNYLYNHKMWKKKAGKVDTAGTDTPIFNALHKDKEVGTPRLGGTIIWISASLVFITVWIVSKFSIPGLEIFDKLEFISRNQTWIPFATLILGAIVGAVDDILEIKGNGGHIAGGLSLKKRLMVVGLIGLAVSSWFHFKLEVSAINLPIFGPLDIGIFIIPFFILVILFIYTSGVIDGLDGLSGGVFACVYAAYAVIAFSLHQVDLAAFCAALTGGILAFLWFNIPPARFYMSETGSMALTITLAVVAFMTDNLGGGIGLFVFPIVAAPLVVTALSSIIQIASKKFRKKKIFIAAPIHHHFEAIGWPSYKVVMRFWVFSIIAAILGIIIALIF